MMMDYFGVFLIGFVINTSHFGKGRIVEDRDFLARLNR